MAIQIKGAACVSIIREAASNTGRLKPAPIRAPVSILVSNPPGATDKTGLEYVVPDWDLSKNFNGICLLFTQFSCIITGKVYRKAKTDVEGGKQSDFGPNTVQKPRIW
jgi:hypothetical protein